MRCRRWTSEDDQRLAELIGQGWKHAVVANKIGRSKGAVSTRAAALKLHTHRRPGRLRKAVKKWHARGLPDYLIARKLKVHLHTVCMSRREQGLPPNPNPTRFKRMAETFRRRYRRSLTDIQHEVYRLRTARDGWPIGCTHWQARLLNELYENGPGTDKELRGRLGISIIPPAFEALQKAYRAGWLERDKIGRVYVYDLTDAVWEGRKAVLNQEAA